MEFAACDARQTGMGSTVVDSMWRAARRLVFRSVPLGILLLLPWRTALRHRTHRSASGWPKAWNDWNSALSINR